MNERLKRKRLLRLLRRISLLPLSFDDALALVSAKQDLKLGITDPEAYERALRVYHNLKHLKVEHGTR